MFFPAEIQYFFPCCYSCETCLSFVSFGDTWVVGDCSQVNSRSLLNEVNDLALLLTKKITTTKVTVKVS